MLAFGAAAAAAILTALLIALARRSSILAIPNARSSHEVPTPTLGGVAIALPVLAWTASRIGQDPLVWAVLGGGGLLAALGLVDDLRDLKARVRLPIQCAAAALAVWALPIVMPLEVVPFSINVWWLIVAFNFVFILWMVNLYNFMDGIDGIAACQCIVYCAGVLLLGRVDAFAAELLWLLLGAAAGFLWFNRSPARIFMGDVGSALLGFLLAIIALTLDARRQMPLIASLILLAGFWFDATYTLCVRILSGQRFTSAHRSHLYQKCAQLLGHGRTTTMFTVFAVVWLMPLAWFVMRMPNFSIAWLALAIAPLLIASIRLRAGHPDEVTGSK
jgi:Fuc2NAc and GlcNAc transferase